MEKNIGELLSQLNEGQQKAVEYIDGPSLVIAGAGSGKTRVLTYKVAYLINKNYAPWNILALTFTNKAAQEMKQRVARIVGDERAAYLTMGTFHSVFSRILRVEAENIGFHSNYTIYDETDSRTLIKNLIKELGLDDTKYKPANVHNIISLAKNRLITASSYAEDAEALGRDKAANMPDLHRVYTAYEQRCRMANAMDFDDLLLNTYLLLFHNEEIRQKYADRFKFVLVDEYQDTNYAQQEIVYLLTKEHQKVCVVGDDAQSIYSFRGANIDNILGFQKLYRDTKLFKLEQNYRSTQLIVKAANSLIQHNQWQIQKNVFSRNDEGDALIYQPLYSDKEEVVVVCRHIRRIKKAENCAYGDFAILYRTNSQSRAFEEQLSKEGIPYRIYGGLSFYQRKEIKDVIAYLRLVVNPDDEEAFRRIINYPTRGIGNTTLAKIIDTAHQQGVSLWHVIGNAEEVGLKLPKGTAAKIDIFRNLITGFIQRMPHEDVFTLGRDIITLSGMEKELLGDTSTEGQARRENVEELLNSMKDFVDDRREEGRGYEVALVDFLQEVSLLTDMDSDTEDEAEGRVVLMTVHSAKGLEFPTVFVVGLEENIFPSPLSTSNIRDLEEERRLLYVAITRAEKYCILTSAQNRMRYGRMEFNPQSRFIKDISPQYMKVESYASPSSSVNPWKTGKNRNSWLQNSRPVATQFKADDMPRIVPPRKPEPPVDPFSEQFRKLQQLHGGRLKRIPTVTGNADSGTPTTSSGTKNDVLRPGCKIKHQRFGVGEVIKVEGTGENMKATVTFVNTGTKQLLVKFAKFEIIG